MLVSYNAVVNNPSLNVKPLVLFNKYILFLTKHVAKCDGQFTLRFSIIKEKLWCITLVVRDCKRDGRLHKIFHFLK